MQIFVFPLKLYKYLVRGNNSDNYIYIYREREREREREGKIKIINNKILKESFLFYQNSIWSVKNTHNFFDISMRTFCGA